MKDVEGGYSKNLKFLKSIMDVHCTILAENPINILELERNLSQKLPKPCESIYERAAPKGRPTLKHFGRRRRVYSPRTKNFILPWKLWRILPKYRNMEAILKC